MPFLFVIKKKVRCLFCGVESKKLDPFLDLSLDIPERFYKENDENNVNEIPICHISDCLSSFTEVINFFPYLTNLNWLFSNCIIVNVMIMSYFCFYINNIQNYFLVVHCQ